MFLFFMVKLLFLAVNGRFWIDRKDIANLIRTFLETFNTKSLNFVRFTIKDVVYRASFIISKVLGGTPVDIISFFYSF